MTGVEQLTLAEKAFEQRDFGAAVAHARAALAAGLDLGVPGSERGEYWQHPEMAQCEIVLGSALLELDDHDGALQHLERAVALDRENERSYANRGHVRRERGELNEALADFDYALERDPSYAFARFRRAQTLLDLQRLEDAEAELARILALNPYDAAPLALWQQLRTRRALPADLDALPAPSDYVRLYQRGLLFAEHGEHARAIADYSAAYALSPQSYLLANRAVAHERLGNLAAARADAEAYLASDPNHANMRSWLATLLERIEKG